MIFQHQATASLTYWKQRLGTYKGTRTAEPTRSLWKEDKGICPYWESTLIPPPSILYPGHDSDWDILLVFTVNWFMLYLNDTFRYSCLHCQWCNWLRHYATNRKVAGSIPIGVIEIFQWRNPSGSNMALGSTQPLIEMSTRIISWEVKAAGA